MGDKLTLKTLWLLQASVLGLALAAGAGCTSQSTSTNVSALPADVKAITFLQRTPRNDDGNVFDYNNFVAGGRLSMLSPPSADGKLTVIFPNAAVCGQILGANASATDISNCVTGSDVQSYDLSFDAKSVVMSAQLPGDGAYQIYSINLDGTNLKQLTSGGNDFVYPVYAPGDQVMFMTNRNVEADTDASSMQFKDEYERAVTAQVGTVSTSGTNLQLGPRNVSHRVSPAHAARRPRALHRVDAHGRGQRRPPPLGQHRHDGDEGGVRRRARGGQPVDEQLPQGPLRLDEVVLRHGGRQDDRRLPGHRGRHLARSHAPVGQALPHRPERQRGELRLEGSDAARSRRPLAQLARDRPLLRRRAGGRRGRRGSS